MSHPDTSGIASSDFTVKDYQLKIWETNPVQQTMFDILTILADGEARVLQVH